MDLAEVMRESLEMLKERPKLFLPRFISTGISTIWILGFLEFGFQNQAFYLATMPVILVLGVFVSIMVADLVDRDSLVLKHSFFSVLGKWKAVLTISTGLFLSALLFSLPLSAGLVGYLYTGNLLILLAGGLTTLLLTMGVSFLIYFLPITVLKHDSVVASFRDSAGTSIKNSREVTLLLGLSLALLAVGGLSEGTLQSAGYIGFALGRFASAVVTTYLFVVSPKFYLENR